MQSSLLIVQLLTFRLEVGLPALNSDVGLNVMKNQEQMSHLASNDGISVPFILLSILVSCRLFRKILQDLRF